MKKMELTEEEAQSILNRREATKKAEEDKRPKKIGILKEDLYEYDGYLPEPVGYFLTESMLDDYFKRVRENSFRLVARAGTVLRCYIEHGNEVRRDDTSAVDYLGQSIARECLIDIKDVK